MKRIMVLNFFWTCLSVALVSASSIEAQCAKAIYLYLDVSGSMTNAEEGDASPFEKSLDVLETVLLGEGSPYFVSGDNVEVHLFSGEVVDGEGRALASPLRAQSREELERIFQDLASLEKRSGVNTDLATVLSSIADRMETTGFRRQIFLVASDFQHEPEAAGGSSETAESLWLQAYASHEDAVGRGFADPAQNVLFLLEADESTREVAHDTSDDFQALAGGRARVRVTFDDPLAEIEQKLRQQLLMPVAVHAQRPPGADELNVTLRNNNCFHVEPKTLLFKCDGISAEARKFPVPVGWTRLAPGDRPDPLTVPMAAIECAGHVDRYLLQLEDPTGLILNQRFDGEHDVAYPGDHLEIDVAAIERAWYFSGRDLLRVKLIIRGQVFHPETTYDIDLIDSNRNQIALVEDFKPPVGISLNKPMELPEDFKTIVKRSEIRVDPGDQLKVAVSKKRPDEQEEKEISDAVPQVSNLERPTPRLQRIYSFLLLCLLFTVYLISGILARDSAHSFFGVAIGTTGAIGGWMTYVTPYVEKGLDLATDSGWHLTLGALGLFLVLWALWHTLFVMWFHTGLRRRGAGALMELGELETSKFKADVERFERNIRCLWAPAAVALALTFLFVLPALEGGARSPAAPSDGSTVQDDAGSAGVKP